MAVRIENQAEPIPGYKLLERLGGGGFGEVWKCEAPGGLHKAIKFVFGDLGAAGDDGHRAEQELKALSRVKTVRHPYILSLERYDIIDGQLLIVMELADKNLWDRFKECRAQGLPGIPRAELLGYMEETAEALDLMNSQYQLQHLDIKPQNLFLVYQHVKVADFGLVKDLEGMQASVTGGVTPVYAAPETFDGWVSRYCDQYSLGIVYQELLTGQRPFNGTNVRQLILQHLQSPPNVNPLPPADRPAIARALSKTPSDRFPTCRALVQALKGGSGSAGPADTLPQHERGTVPDLDARSGQTPGTALSSLPTGPLTAVDAITDHGGTGIPARAGVAGQECPAHWVGGPISITPPEVATANIRFRPPDSNPGTTHLIRAMEGAVLQPEAPDGPRQVAPEVHGDGVLAPALVIGLGQLGLGVLQRLREHLHSRFGGMDQLPHLHLLVLDTDPEMVRAATRGPQGARLSEADVLLAPLNRPSHYLKARDGRPDVSGWLNPRMLYRIPRSQVTTGVRALGRLAFCDNYRLIVRRLQTELEACLSPEALSSAVHSTQLGVRTNRLRVYVVTSLAGGTGSGMFLDLAYTVRALLKQAGYEQPDVVGLFLLPEVDRNRTRILTLGNACAALRELRHFAAAGTCFSAQYHQREAPIRDSEPPFGRCILLPLPEETDEAATRELLEQAGQFLARDLCSPLGRVADLARAGQSGPPWESRGLYYQTFGLFPLSWPRPALLRGAARQLCQRLVQRWMSKDSKPLREAVQTWMQEQWTRQELGSSILMGRLGEACRQALGQDPEDAFRAILDARCERSGSDDGTIPLPSLPSEGEAKGKGRNGRKGGADAELSPNAIADVLRRYEKLLGKPQEALGSEPSGKLIDVLREAADKLVQSWGQKLAELPVHLIEAPEFRLAGAEEAIRQIVASIEQALQHHEPLSRELTTRAADAYTRLQALSAAPQPVAPSSLLGALSGGRRAAPPAAEVIELLRNYPKWLYQSLLLRQVGNVFLTLRGHLADEMREVGFCRVRLGELLRMLDEPAEGQPLPEGVVRLEMGSSGGPVIGRHLFPAGRKNLKEAIEHVLGGLGEGALHELDVRVEAMLRKSFTALANVCLSSANVLKNVEPAMRQTAEAFVAERLSQTDVAEMFLELYPDPEQAVEELANFFAKAAPELPADRKSRGPELAVIAAPSGPAGDHFRDLVRQAVPDVEWQSAAGNEDILLYRELSGLPLADLPQLGPLGQDAYRQMSSAEHFTPHCRTDIDFTVH